MTWIAYGVVVWLFLTGLYGVVTSRNLVHLVGCLGVTQAAGYLFLLCLGYREGAAPPVAQGSTPPPPGTEVDPVVQALTLTGIVVGAVVTALLLAVAIQAEKRFGTLDPHALRAIEK